MSFVLAGIGTAVPQHSIGQREAARFALDYCPGGDSRPKLLEALYRRSGVELRHCVILDASTNGRPAQQSFYAPAATATDRGPSTARRMQAYDTAASTLARQAATAALEDAMIAPADVTHLVTVSCSGFHAPGVDIGLIRDLELPPGTARTHIGFMGCHAALNALRVARSYALADPRACVLLCAVELCSLHHQYGWNPHRIVANSLFADGAAAVVGRRGDRDNDGAWQLRASGSAVLPDTSELMAWSIGDHGFEMTLSPRVPEVIRRTLKPWLAGWLAEQGLSIDAIGSWAIHPGGPKILRACADAVQLDDDLLRPSESVLTRYGNMSSPTVLFILDELRAAQAARPCVMLAFGPGLTIEAALVG